MGRLISDNYVTGDNIYLRELQNFFFEVLGMMSITHYGAIGDGRRDNYGPLQVAIDDANRRGLSFLYVPYGRFIYTGELTNLIDEETGKQKITFMGNPHAHIVNIRTGEEIEIHQFGWQQDADLTNYYTKEEIDQLLQAKQNRLVAGENITIEDNVISATSGGGGGTTETAFFSCPFPTSWSGSDTSRTGTNTYGTWTISTAKADGSSISIIDGHTVNYGFDNDVDTYIKAVTGPNARAQVTIETPTNVSIKPAHILVKSIGTVGNTTYPATKFQGYNASTNTWDTLHTWTVNGRNTVDVDISANEYYTKFRVTDIYYSIAQTGESSYMYEFQITSGYIKEES